MHVVEFKLQKFLFFEQKNLKYPGTEVTDSPVSPGALFSQGGIELLGVHCTLLRSGTSRPSGKDFVSIEIGHQISVSK